MIYEATNRIILRQQNMRKMKNFGIMVGVIMLITLYSCNNNSVEYTITDPVISGKVEDLLKQMTLTEKIGQMSQINGFHEELPADFMLR
jgi:hypothetical protein